MKRSLKIAIISVVSFLLLIFIGAGLVILSLLNTERITPFVQKQADKLLTCESQIGNIDAVFFSSFPKFGIKVEQLLLLNKIPDAQSDTLASIENLILTVDIKELVIHNEIAIDGLDIDGLVANVFFDSAGFSNLDVIKIDTTYEEVTQEPFENPFKEINLQDIQIKNAAVSYVDKGLDIALYIKALHGTFDGCMVGNKLDGKAKIASPLVSFTYEGDAYLNTQPFSIDMPVSIEISDIIKVCLNKAKIAICNQKFTASGDVGYNTINGDITTDLNFDTEKWKLEELMTLIPECFDSMTYGIEASGLVSAAGSIIGTISDSIFPVVSVDLSTSKCQFSYVDIPTDIHNIEGNILIYCDVNRDSASFVKFNQVKASLPKSDFEVSGLIDQLFTDIRCDIDVDLDLNIVDILPFVPDSMNLSAAGTATGSANAKLTLTQLEKMEIGKMDISGDVTFSNFKAEYDTIYVDANKAKIKFSIPNKKPSSNKSPRFLNADIACNKLSVNVADTIKADINNFKIAVETSDITDTTRLPDVVCRLSSKTIAASMDSIFVDAANADIKIEMPNKNAGSNSNDFLLAKILCDKLNANVADTIKADISKLNLTVTTSDLTDTTQLPDFNCIFAASSVIAELDTISANIENTNGNIAFDSRRDSNDININVIYHNDSFEAHVGNFISAATAVLDIKADIDGEKQSDSTSYIWDPTGYIDLDGGQILTDAIPYSICIPSIKLYFEPEKYTIKESYINIGNSDFQLVGELNDMASFLRDKSLLTGIFHFVSEQTDVTELMGLVSGFGDTTTVAESANPSESDPFIVPKKVDISLKTDIEAAILGNDTIKKIEGNVVVNDGSLVLENMKMTMPASKVQLSAIYKTPRRNHLFVGMDFHLLDIEINRLLTMIPDIDSIMPMLRSFGGNGEFHFAAETYLFSDYSPKMSTLRGAASIRGENLVLMDGETFSEIAKTLMFNKKTENKIDSLSAEFTIFRNEVDVYPFLIVMDKYKAVVGGRHNLDMSFDYHISLTDSPLPMNLGVDVVGTIEDMKIRPAQCKYAKLYRPVSRKEVDKSQLEIRKMIHESLAGKVVE